MQYFGKSLEIKRFNKSRLQSQLGCLSKNNLWRCTGAKLQENNVFDCPKTNGCNSTYKIYSVLLIFPPVVSSFWEICIQFLKFYTYFHDPFHSFPPLYIHIFVSTFTSKQTCTFFPLPPNWTLWHSSVKLGSDHNAPVVAGLQASEPGNRLDASIPTLWHPSRHTCMQDNLLRMSRLV